MPSRRDVLKAGGLAAAGVVAGTAAVRYGAWSPSLLTPPDGTWLQPRYDYGNTGHSSDATPPTESPDLAWTGDVAESVNALVAGVGHLYAGTEHAVYAFEYGERNPRWDRPASGYRLAAGNDVVVAAGRNTVTAFEASTGRERWRQSTGNSAYGLLVDERTAYVGWRGQLDAYALGGGGRRWSLETSSRTFPGFDDGRLLVGGGYLDAYDHRGALDGVLDDGPTRVWQCEDVHGPTHPVAAGEYTLVGTNTCLQSPTCGLAAVADDGSREYHVELGNNAGQVATDGDRAYVVSMLYGEPENGYNTADSTTLHALDVGTGDRLWSFQRPGWFSAPVVANDTVYVGESGSRNGDGNLHALDAENGDRRWSYTGADGVNTLVAAGDSLFVGSDGGTVHELQ